jgi:predicted glycogen debranching enzyme
VRSLPAAALSGEAALRSVRGLIALRRFEPARDLLLLLGQLVRDGLVPSGFDDAGRPRYDAPEPALWLVIATELFARRAGEQEFVQRSLYSALEQVVERYRGGTRLGIGASDDGLLAAGEERPEKRADLNALWYRAQAALGQLARSLGRREHAAFHLARAREVQVRFEEALWDDEGGCLFHALGTSGPVRGLEPSQVLAASLSPPLLAPERAARLVATIERELFTPLGLRDSPGSPRLVTEWIGPFVTAFVRANGRTAAAQERARGWLDVLARHLERHAAVHLPVAFEVGGGPLDSASIRYDGDPVSVLAAAELARAWIEELDHGLERGGP